jgi:hypothetical protein
MVMGLSTGSEVNRDWPIVHRHETGRSNVHPENALRLRARRVRGSVEPSPEARFRVCPWLALPSDRGPRHVQVSRSSSGLDSVVTRAVITLALRLADRRRSGAPLRGPQAGMARGRSQLGLSWLPSAALTSGPRPGALPPLPAPCPACATGEDAALRLRSRALRSAARTGHRE